MEKTSATRVANFITRDGATGAGWTVPTTSANGFGGGLDHRYMAGAGTRAPTRPDEPRDGPDMSRLRVTHITHRDLVYIRRGGMLMLRDGSSSDEDSSDEDSSDEDSSDKDSSDEFEAAGDSEGEGAADFIPELRGFTRGIACYRRRNATAALLRKTLAAAIQAELDGSPPYSFITLNQASEHWRRIIDTATADWPKTYEADLDRKAWADIWNEGHSAEISRHKALFLPDMMSEKERVLT